MYAFTVEFHELGRMVHPKPQSQREPNEARASPHVGVSGVEVLIRLETMSESTVFNDALTACCEIDMLGSMAVLLADNYDPQRLAVLQEIVVPAHVR